MTMPTIRPGSRPWSDAAIAAMFDQRSRRGDSSGLRDLILATTTTTAQSAAGTRRIGPSFPGRSRTRSSPPCSPWPSLPSPCSGSGAFRQDPGPKATTEWFERPFEYAIPAGSGLRPAADGPHRAVIAWVEGPDVSPGPSADPLEGQTLTDYGEQRPDSGKMRGIIIGSGERAWSHAASRFFLNPAPAAFIADLRDRSGVAMGPIVETSLDGRPALTTVLAGTANNDIHVDSPITGFASGPFVLVNDPARLIVTEVDGETIFILIWAQDNGRPRQHGCRLPTSSSGPSSSCPREAIMISTSPRARARPHPPTGTSSGWDGTRARIAGLSVAVALLGTGCAPATAARRRRWPRHHPRPGRPRSAVIASAGLEPESQIVAPRRKRAVGSASGRRVRGCQGGGNARGPRRGGPCRGAGHDRGRDHRGRSMVGRGGHRRPGRPPGDASRRIRDCEPHQDAHGRVDHAARREGHDRSGCAARHLHGRLRSRHERCDGAPGPRHGGRSGRPRRRCPRPDRRGSGSRMDVARDGSPATCRRPLRPAATSTRARPTSSSPLPPSRRPGRRTVRPCGRRSWTRSMRIGSSIRRPEASTPQPWAVPINEHLGRFLPPTSARAARSPASRPHRSERAPGRVASDAPSLARWLWHLFAGDILEIATLDPMIAAGLREWAYGFGFGALLGGGSDRELRRQDRVRLAVGLLPVVAGDRRHLRERSGLHRGANRRSASGGAAVAP